MELWFTMEKLWYYGKNIGTMEKNYGFIPKTIYGTSIYNWIKHDGFPKTLIYNGKTMAIYQNNWSFWTNI